MPTTTFESQWDLITLNWDEIQFTWDELWILETLVTDAAIDGSSGRRKVKRKYVEKKIQELSKEDKKQLITLFFRIADKEIVQEEELSKVEVTIEDVSIVLKEAIKVDVIL